jgi:hypothetical protein
MWSISSFLLSLSYIPSNIIPKIIFTFGNQQTGHIRTSHGSYFIEPLPRNSEEYLKQKQREKLLQQNQPENNSSTQKNSNEEQEILHEIYQVGLDMLTNNEEKNKDKNIKNEGDTVPTTTTNSDNTGITPSTDENYSYESSDNLQIGSTITYYEDEDEHDDYWLNPGVVTPKPRQSSSSLPKTNSINTKSRTKRSRIKRSMSKERFVELSVVTDASMSTYHGVC